MVEREVLLGDMVEVVMGACMHGMGELSLQARHQDLALWVAESRIEFEDVTCLRFPMDDKPAIEDTAIGASLLCHGANGGCDDVVDGACLYLLVLCVDCIRTESAHASCLRSLVTIFAPFIVKAHTKGFYGLSVCHDKEAHFISFEEFFDDDMLSRLS